MNLRLVAMITASIALSGCAGVAPRVQNMCFHLNEAIETDIGFCQARRIGTTLYVSGTAGQGEMQSAIRSVYRRLRETLQANGLDFVNVVKETVYATDLDAFIQHKNIRKEFYDQGLPAATWVQVQRLYLPSFVVEIELTAEYPK